MLKNISVTFFNQLFGVLLGVINSILITRLLGVEGKGVFALLIAFIGLSTVFLNIGLPAAVTYFISSEQYKINKIFYTGIILISFLSFLFIGFLLFNNRIIDSVLLPTYLQSAKFEIILALFFFFKLFNSFLRAIFLGIQSIIKLNKLDIAFQILSTCVYLALFYTLATDDNTNFTSKVLYLILIQLGIQALNACANLFILVKENKMKFELILLNRKELKHFIFWGGIAYFSNIFQFLSYRLDFWFVEYFSGLKSIGVYSLSVNLIQMIWILPNAISMVLFPYISDNKDAKNKEEKTLIIGRIIFSILLLIGIIAFILSPLIIPVLYGEEFSPASSSFNILLISAIPFGLITVYASFLVGKGMQSKNLIASLLGLIFTVILDVLLIPKYGIIGAAWASTISYLVTSVYVLYEMNKILRKGYLDLFFLKKSDIYMIKNMIYGKRGN